jgi:hypothetical protein
MTAKMGAEICLLQIQGDDESEKMIGTIATDMMWLADNPEK